MTLTNDKIAPYKDSSLSINIRADDLVSRMTLEEKISQMLFDAPAIERLDIPKHNWWNEGLHGVGRAGLATVFPQAIGLAASWNPDLIHRVATAISDEARAKHHEAARRGIREIYTGLTFWSPNINIFRDPRWGRGQETYGEDPYLTTALGMAFIKGLQGDHPRYLKLTATPKHYAVHSGPEADRHHFDARIDDQTLWETYLPAFEACIKEGRAASIMGAYNRLNGEACCASPTLLGKILREKWGFEGYVVSDCWAIVDFYAHHKIVDTPAEAAALAVKEGCDLNCGSTYPHLLEAVRQGLISEDEIDVAVNRLFSARFRLGMFDPPEAVPYTGIPYDVVNSPSHQTLSLEAARESIVLLKNQAGLLPLSKDIGSIAVVGPNADSRLALLGNYNGTPRTGITPLEGIREKISDSVRLYHAQACGLADEAPPLEVIPTAVLRPETAAGNITGLDASYFGNPGFLYEPAVIRVDRIVDFVWNDTTPLTQQWGDHFSVRWSGFLVPPASGNYTLGVNGFSAYALYLDDELIVDYEDIHHPVIRSKIRHLEAGRFYRIRLDYVSRGLDPQVQLLWAPPDVDYETPALDAARQAELVVAVMGLSAALEGEEMPVHIDGFAGGDRTDISLPASQKRFLKKLNGLGKPIILVLLNGSALAVPWAAEHIPAIVEAWYPGQAGGRALADVLFGDYNPAGRLPVTFYKAVEDLPPFEDYRMTGRTYRYFEGEALFPFGHGLSYTTFFFDNMSFDRSQIEAGETITISLEVTNSGTRAGKEVVQVYVRRPDTAGPLRELKAFKRVHLQPGERQTITFSLHTDLFATYDEATQQFVLKPGAFEVMAGSSSQNLPLGHAFEIVGQPVEIGDKKVFLEGGRSS